MIKNLAIVLTLLCFGSLNAQTPENFERLISKGDIPDLFVKYLEDKIAKDNEDLLDDNTISRTNAKDFSAITNYKLHQVIQSGRILYGDPLTVYANKVLDKLKESSDEDLEDIEVYTLKSNEVNAFATHQGVIFLTVGLWGQIENEAQLAYVLAHEITHIYEKHNQLSYQHTEDLIRNGRYGDDKISAYYQYSKDNEEDADKAGFKLALAAGYDATEIFGTFNVLLYSYLPIDEMKVEYSWLENEGFKVTEDFILEEIKEISPAEDVDDEYHTHPNINNRRTNVKSIYNANKSEKKEIYVVGTEEEFKATRELARFEMMNIYIRQAEYLDGIYHNLILTKSHPNNIFLARTRAMSWYGFTAHDNSDDGTVFSTSYRKKEGEIQQLYYFFNKIKDSELAAIATQQVWKTSLSNPEDDFLVKIREKTMNEFAKFSENDITNFATEIIESVEEEEVEVDESKLSKYDKIAKKRKKETEEDFTYYALLDIVDKQEFVDAYDKAKKENKEKDEEEEEYENLDGPQENTMDVNNLIMISPNYYKQDNRISINKNVDKNDLNETRLINLVKENADRLDINISFIDNFKDPEFDTDAYNEFSLLYDYLGERSQY
ncbi:MAG: M48 family metalloprotease, partial [Bacteroidia bacterium]|nr:M48 family metalloprotease [Bacteroidia bacterium]NNJ55239.1 M48 family metalloprotease [Bacteroidia bacterium]